MAREVCRSARNAAGGLIIQPLKAPSYREAEVMKAYGTRPNFSEHPAFRGAAGVISDSRIKAAMTSRANNWVN